MIGMSVHDVYRSCTLCTFLSTLSAKHSLSVDIEIKGESRRAPPGGGLGGRARTLLALSETAQSLPALSERLASRASTRIELYRDPGTSRVQRFKSFMPIEIQVCHPLNLAGRSCA